MYATRDFALLDLLNGELWSWRAGSISTYVIRGENVVHLESIASTIDFMPNYEVTAQKISLLSGDIIMMISDGIFSAEGSWHEQEQFY